MRLESPPPGRYSSHVRNPITGSRHGFPRASLSSAVAVQGFDRVTCHRPACKKLVSRPDEMVHMRGRFAAGAAPRGRSLRTEPMRRPCASGGPPEAQAQSAALGPCAASQCSCLRANRYRRRSRLARGRVRYPRSPGQATFRWANGRFLRPSAAYAGAVSLWPR